MIECNVCKLEIYNRDIELHYLSHEIKDLTSTLQKWLPEIIGAIRGEK